MIDILILLLGVFFLAVCLLGLVRWIAIPRTRAIRRVAEIEAYGSVGQIALTGSVVPAEASTGGLAGLAGRIGVFVLRRFGRVREEHLRAELMAAGMYTTSPRTVLGYRVLAAILLPLAILLIGTFSKLSILVAIVSVAIGWMFPLIVVRRKARLRLTQIDRGLPNLVDLLVVTVEAGLGFNASLRVASDQFTGPLRDELRLTLQEHAMGLSMGDALTHLLGRVDTPSMRSFVRAVIQGENLGVSTGTIMRNIAVDMRKRRRSGAEERSRKAPVKLLFPLVFLIFPSMFVVLLLPALFSIEHIFS